MIEISISQAQERVPVTALSLRGAADAASAHEIRRIAEEAIRAGARNLLIDLSETLYISRAGLAAIDHIHEFLLASQSPEVSRATLKGIHRGTSRSAHLKLVNPTPAALHALRAAGLDMYLEIHHDLKDAIASFGTGAPRGQREEKQIPHGVGQSQQQELRQPPHPFPG